MPAQTLPDRIDLTDLDLWGAAIPHAFLRTLRDEAPCFWQDERDGRGFWSLTRYDDVVAASRDWETYSSALGGTSLQDLTPEQVERRKSMLDMDPPEHTRLRGILNRAFTARAIMAYEDRIRAIIREVLDAALARTEPFDWVHEVSVEIPMRILAELMGVPAEDRAHLIALGDRLLVGTDPDLAGPDETRTTQVDPRYADLPFSSPASLEMFDYSQRLFDDRRRTPRSDIATRLIEAEVDGDHLTAHELNLFFLLLITAGHETTRNAISLGLESLLAHPEERARIAADPVGLASTTADEILRIACSLLHFRRTATRDVELHGETIRAGDKVLVWYISANRDERQFADPMRFDAGRQPNRHVAFGLGGPHFCLGANLARLELRLLVEELGRDLPRLDAAGPAVRALELLQRAQAAAGRRALVAPSVRRPRAPDAASAPSPDRERPQPLGHRARRHELGDRLAGRPARASCRACRAPRRRRRPRAPAPARAAAGRPTGRGRRPADGARLVGARAPVAESTSSRRRRTAARGAGRARSTTTAARRTPRCAARPRTSSCRSSTRS